MGFIPVNFDDVAEAKPATPGFHTLQITGCEVVKTGPESKKPGTPMYRVSIGLPEEPDTMNLSHYITLPNEDDDAKTLQNKALGLKRFLEMFHVPYDKSGIDVDKIAFDMIGCTAQGETELSEPDPKSGKIYSRLRVPYLKA